MRNHPYPPEPFIGQVPVPSPRPMRAFVPRRRRRWPQPQELQPPPTTTTSKSVPFDYVFQFPLKGERGNKVQDVVEISVEGLFVALSVGYSLVLDESNQPRTFAPVVDQRTIPPRPVAVPVFTQPPTGAPLDFSGFVVLGMPEAEIAILDFAAALPRLEIVSRIGAEGFVKVDLPPAAGLRSLRVWDRTNNLLGEAFITATTVAGLGPVTVPMVGPNPITQRLPEAGDNKVFVYGMPNDPVNVSLLRPATSPGDIDPVTGKAFALPSVEMLGSVTGRAEIPLGTTLSAGDILLVWRDLSPGIRLPSMFTIPRPRPSTITLGALAAGLERFGADLTSGFRLNPNFAGTDLPFDQLTAGTLESVFETGAIAAEEVSFLYSLDVPGSGREYQNEPIHNIAGLGIANGDRPFRPFARPILFEPRSSIRIQIEEISGPPGNLFIVLQGYKILGAGQTPR